VFSDMYDFARYRQEWECTEFSSHPSLFLWLFLLWSDAIPIYWHFVNRDGNGNGPSPTPGQPPVSSVGPGTAVAGGPSFALTVNGPNFVPITTVLWNGVRVGPISARH
jgi:hypothetical protein